MLMSPLGNHGRSAAISPLLQVKHYSRPNQQRIGITQWEEVQQTVESLPANVMAKTLEFRSVI